MPVTPRPRVADDFEAIRARLAELRREREPKPEADRRCYSCRQNGTVCTGACYGD